MTIQVDVRHDWGGKKHYFHFMATITKFGTVSPAETHEKPWAWTLKKKKLTQSSLHWSKFNLCCPMGNITFIRERLKSNGVKISVEVKWRVLFWWMFSALRFWSFIKFTHHLLKLTQGNRTVDSSHWLHNVFIFEWTILLSKKNIFTAKASDHPYVLQKIFILHFIIYESYEVIYVTADS